MGSLRRAVAAVLAVVVAAGLLTGCSFGHRRGTAIGASGGTAVSADGTVSVTFGAGEADAGTRVRVDTGSGGPPPPAMMAPLDRPFDVVVEGGKAHTGTVTVKVGPLPDGVAPASVYLLIENTPGSWQLLPTKVDVGAGTLTARFPHFSKGAGVFLDPLRGASHNVADAAGDAWKWGSKQAKDGASKAKDEAASAARAIASGAAALAGGTTDSVSCKPSSADWTFASGNGTGGHMNFPPLTACAEPPDGDGKYRLHVGNRYAYPYLLTVPGGVYPPGFADLPASMDLADMLLTMVWSMSDRVVVPAGGNTVLGLTPGAGAGVQIPATIDLSTLAVRAVALLALLATDGMTGADTAAAKAEVRAEYDDLYAGLAASRKAGNDTVRLSDIVERTKWNSELARKERNLNRVAVAVAVDQFFTNIDFLTCAKSTIADAGDLSNPTKAVGTMVDKMLGECWPAWAGRTATNVVTDAGALLDETAREAAARELAKGIVDQALQVRSLFAGSLALRLANDRFDYLHARLDVTAAWLAPYVGQFHGHDRTITIAADGQGTFAARTYLDCADPASRNQSLPCEDPYTNYAIKVKFHLVTKNGKVYARITESNTRAIAGDLPVAFQEPGVLSFWSTTLCDPKTVPPDHDSDVCGA